MYLINEVINDLKNTGWSNVYVHQNRAKKYSVIKFRIINGYLTIVSDQHFFDKSVWNGDRINPRAKEVQTKRILQYSADPKVREELDYQDNFENRLNAIVALLMAHTLKPGNAEVEYLPKRTNDLKKSFYWASFLADKVIRTLELSYQELINFIDSDVKEVAKALKRKVDENDEALEYPDYNALVMSELYVDTIGKAYDEVKEADAETKKAMNNWEYRRAIKKWRELSSSTEPIIMLSKKCERSAKAK